MRREILANVAGALGRGSRRLPRCGRERRVRASATAKLQYDRGRDLPPLLALWPWELEDAGIDGQQRLVARLRRALRLERQRAIAGHWTYDLARHARLLAAYRSEVANLKSMLEAEDSQVRSVSKSTHQ